LKGPIEFGVLSLEFRVLVAENPQNSLQLAGLTLTSFSNYGNSKPQTPNAKPYAMLIPP
jgi:hypothetical protein